MTVDAGKMVGTIVGIIVAVIVLAALTPSLISATNTFSSTVANQTSLSPIKPLADNLPLLVLLAFVVGIILAVVKMFKTE